MRFSVVAVLAFVLLAAGQVRAASAIVTPAIQPSDAGVLECWTVNASDTKSLQIRTDIRNVSGTVVTSGSATIAPGAATYWSSSGAQACFCVVNVLSGARKNAIVSLVAIEGGIPVASVAAK